MYVFCCYSRYQKDQKLPNKLYYCRNSVLILLFSIYGHHTEALVWLLQGRIACVVHVNPHDQTIVHQDCYPKVMNFELSLPSESRLQTFQNLTCSYFLPVSWWGLELYSRMNRLFQTNLAWSAGGCCILNRWWWMCTWWYFSCTTTICIYW